MINISGNCLWARCSAKSLAHNTRGCCVQHMSNFDHEPPNWLFLVCCVNCTSFFYVKSSRACSLLMLETKSVCETVYLNYLTWLSAREDFTVLSSRKLPLFRKFISSLFNNSIIVGFEKHQTLKLQLTFSMCEGKILLCFKVLCNLFPL